MSSRFTDAPQIEAIGAFSGQDLETLTQERAANMAAWAIKAEIDVQFGGDPAQAERELVAAQNEVESDYQAAMRMLKNKPVAHSLEPAATDERARECKVDQAVGQAALHEAAPKPAPLTPTPPHVRVEPFRNGTAAPIRPAQRATTARTVTAHVPAKPKATANQDPALEEPAEPSTQGRQITAEDFEDVFARFQGPLTSFAYRLVGNRDEALDVAQDSLVKAFRALAGGTHVREGTLSAWLYRITGNTATDLLRRRKLITWLPTSLFNEDRLGAELGSRLPSDPETARDTKTFSSAMVGMNSLAAYDGGRFEQRIGVQEVVMRVLDRLDEDERTAILLYDHEGFSNAHLAKFFGVTPAAFKMRLMRARDHFIQLYNSETGEQRQRARRNETATGSGKNTDELAAS